MLLGGYPAFAILFVGAGVGRLAAARATEVKAPATSAAGEEDAVAPPTPDAASS
jgi:hypothetical protein